MSAKKHRSRIALGLVAVFAVGLAPAARADIVLSDFNAFSTQLTPPMFATWHNGSDDQYTQGAGFISIAPVGGGNPTGNGYFLAALPGNATVDFSSVGNLSLTARVDAGNADIGFNIVLWDNTNTQQAYASFLTEDFSSNFSTHLSELVVFGDSVAHITSWSIGGSGDASTDAFRFSFGDLTGPAVVPEPSTYGGLAALLATAMVAAREWRRRNFVSVK